MAILFMILKKKLFSEIWFYISVFIIIFLPVLLPAQAPNIKFSHITLEDGLSQSSIYSIVQDNKGFMWFATLDGLNKYDGYNITIYRNNPTDSNSIADNVLNYLYVDRPEYGGKLWIGTRGAGLCEFDEIFDRFKTYSHNKTNHQSISSNNVRHIYGDKNFLWIATGKGLNKMDRKTGVFKIYDFKEKNKNFINCIIPSGKILYLATNNGLCIFNKTNEKYHFLKFSEKNTKAVLLNTITSGVLDNKEILWLGSHNGLIKFDTKKQKYEVLKKNSNSLSSNIITFVIIDKDQILWIGTEKGGLNRYDKEKNEFSIYKNDPAIRYSLQNNNILSLYQNKENILWIGSSLGGVDKWNRAAEELSLFRHNPYDENSLSNNQVRNIYQDRKGRIWVGTVLGGLNLFIKSQNKFIHYMHNPDNPNSLSNNHVRDILEDSKGRFWVATDGGGFCRFFPEKEKFISFTTDNSKLSNNRVWCITEDNNGQLWLATYGGGVNIFNPEKETFSVYKNTDTPNSLSNDYITTIFKDHLNNIWIGTFGGGLNLWQPQTKSFKIFKYDAQNPKSIGNNRIYAINEDSKGRMWIGEKGALSLFDRNTQEFQNFDERHGLPNNVIMGILEDSHGNIWVSTNRGLSKFNPETKKVRNYDIRDGLQSNEFLVGSYCKTREGKFIFGGINGFNVFNPDKIVDNPNPPSVVITGFRISNQPVKFDTTISNKKVIILNHKQNDISFDFVALDYIFPTKNQYKYKLIGYDDNWVDIKFKKFATYTNLLPGDYIFKVIGSNNDEVWNMEGTQIKVIIEPALWQRLWFKITLIVFIILIISLWFYLRIRRIKKQNEYLEKQVQLRTAEIVRQKELIEEHLHEISEQKREITDSIHYAKRIQTAALPVEKFMQQVIPEHFVLFKPKDIVSGDFYWTTEKDEKSIVVAADCTGHGVPGAFMSMLGISFLNKIVNEKGITEPDKILNRLRKNVIQALHQRGKEEDTKDGMDITICTIIKNENKLQFAGANNPLYIVLNNEMHVIKGDKMPIAFYDHMKPFTLHELNINKNDIFYIFSDGFADQFGGPKGKKFMYKPFRRLLMEIHNEPMKKQKEILNNTIENWKKDLEQVDDIVVFGVRL